MKNYHSLQQEISLKDQQIVTLSNELLMKQQLLYEKEKILENKSYEEKFAKKSIENQLLEINNLKDIINNFENSFSSEMKEWKRKFYEMKEEKEKNVIAFEEKKKLEIHQIQSNYQQEIEKYRKLVEEKEITMKHLQQQQWKEKQSLQQNMERTLFQLQNTNSNVIDKQLIGNLIVSYFQRRRSFFL